MQTKNFDLLIAYYQKAAMDPSIDPVNALKSLGLSYWVAGQNDNAVATFRKMLTLPFAATSTIPAQIKQVIQDIQSGKKAPL